MQGQLESEFAVKKCHSIEEILMKRRSALKRAGTAAALAAMKGAAGQSASRSWHFRALPPMAHSESPPQLAESAANSGIRG